MTVRGTADHPDPGPVGAAGEPQGELEAEPPGLGAREGISAASFGVQDVG